MTQNNNQSANNPDLIVEYTDAEAISDGVLIDIHDHDLYFPVGGQLKHIDRITGNLMAEFEGDYNGITLDEVIKFIDYAVATNADKSDPTLITVVITQIGKTIWLMPNERENHYTAMLPSDY